MNQTIDDLVEQARKLPAADRAKLVADILQSLDEPDPAVDASWREEVERRAQGMDDGVRPATPWSEARSKLVP